VRDRLRTARPRPEGTASRQPVARVAVDISLAHLDRPFDYLVPESLSEQALPGARVRVRFAGQRVDGYVLARVDRSEHQGRLGRLERVVSSEVVLHEEVAALCRAVADHYAGTLADVIRLAVPPRHGRTERLAARSSPTTPLPDVDPSAWTPYQGGPSLLDRLTRGEAPRACWNALPGEDWTAPLAQAVLATARSGRGSIVCLPDVRDVARVDAALARALGPDRHVVLTADAGPQARYRAFLDVSRGRVQIVVGTRAAAFAPVHDLGLVAMWDDGNDLFAEPRAPYPHAREVLVRRAHDVAAGTLLGGYARSVEAQALVESGWCVDLAAASARRGHGARVTVAGASGRDPGAGAARVPHEAMTTIRQGLAAGPVLVSVARAGYRPVLACQDCRRPARCGRCGGPLAQSADADDPRCRWCGLVTESWRCPSCGGVRLRAPVVGERRTAVEIERAFPGVRVRTASAAGIPDDVADRPEIVIATPGAEAVATNGYAAAVVLDTGLSLSRPDLRTSEESVRRWFNVIGLVRPAARAGRVCVVGDSTAPQVQALVRSDPAGFAARELSERRAARLPPAARLAAIVALREEATTLLGEEWPPSADVLGPVAVDDERDRVVVRVPRQHGAALARSLQVLQAGRSARKATPIRVALDPVDLG